MFRAKVYRISIVCICIYISFVGFMYAQGKSPSTTGDVFIPSEEKFVKADGLIIPWKVSGCWPTAMIRESDCQDLPGRPAFFVTVEEEVKSSKGLKLFHPNGSLWVSFSLQPDDEDYVTRKTHFKPFSAFIKRAPKIVVLRLEAESPSWYEVEVNEETRETKYIAKNDPLWARSTWELWLNRSARFVIDNDRTKLHDRPDGKVIEEAADITFPHFSFIKAEGDWIYVQGVVFLKRNYHGWIRWRDGRKILVGWLLNDFEVPEK